MKKTKNLIIMVVILVLLVGAYALYRILDTGEEGPSEETGSSSPKVEALVEVEADNVDTVTITNAEDQIVLKSERFTPTPTPTPEDYVPVTGKAEEEPKPIQKWIWEGEAPVGLDQGKLDSLGKNLMRLSSIEDLGEKETEALAEYGLDKAQASLKYALNNGDSIEVLLGNQVQSASSSQYYAYNKTTKRLGVVSSPAQYMLTTRYDLMENKLVPYNAYELKGFDLTRLGEPYPIKAKNLAPLSHEDSMDEEKLHEAKAEWQLESPVSWAGNSNTILAFLTELQDLQADSFLPYKEEDLAKYGLDTPQYQLSLEGENGTIQYAFGQSVSGDVRYGMVEGQDRIFSYKAQDLSKIGAKTLEFYDRFAALVNIQDAGKLTVDLDQDGVYVSDIFHPSKEEEEAAGDKELEPTYTLNGKDANVKNASDKKLFSKYYQAVIGVRFAGIDKEANPSADDAAVYKITYEMRTDKDDIRLAFTKRDDKTLYVFKDGVYTGFYADIMDFEDNGDLDSPSVKLALQELEKAIN
jgi:hypothetical protein